MKLGMTSLTLRAEEPASVVDYVVSAGLGGIEWGVSDKHIVLGDTGRARMIAQLCADRGVEVFALGSYCRMETRDDLDAAVECASVLGAPVIRIWAGTKSPSDCTEEDILRVVENTRYMADIAKEHNIVLGFEYHGGTLTETATDAVSLIERIDRENVGLYWQPDFNLTCEQNLADRDVVLPYCVGNMHIQNYNETDGYGLLADMEDTLKKYYDDIKSEPYRLMIEFVKDGSVDNLNSDALALRRVVGLDSVLHLIPSPKHIEESRIPIEKRKVCVKSQPKDARLCKALNKLPLSDDGIELTISGEEGTGEGYRLCLTNSSADITAEGAPGVFYAIQTLRQIFENDNIFELVIEDKPDFRYRGYYHDVTRGKVPKVDSLKKLIDDLAYYKTNSFMIYVEHSFPFKEFEGVWDNNCYITPDEIRELDAYCRDNFIDFVPSMATFGHLYELLQQERYAHLRELEDHKPEYVFWYERMLHHTLDPLNPESFEVVRSMLDQYLPLFTSDWVHICGDEPFDLLIGKHKDMDTDELYVDFMLKVIDYVKSKGKKVMMWGSSIQEIVGKGKIACASKIPEDVVLIPHGYLADAPEQRVINISKLPNPFVVSPGTSSWFRLVENVGISEKNIPRIAGFTKKYNGDGMLNTAWGDYGNPCSIELGMYGAVMGAEKCWNLQTEVTGADFKEAVSLLLYKQPMGAQYLYELSRLAEGAEYATFVRDYSNITFPGKIDVELPDEETLRKTSEGCRKFVQKLSSEAEWLLDNYRREMLIAAEGIAVCAELFAQTLGYNVTRWTDTESWLAKYRSMWLSKNKESELGEIEKMFRYLDGCGYVDRVIKNEDAAKLDKNIFW